MNILKSFWIGMTVIGLGVNSSTAQTSGEVETLKRELQEMRERMAAMEKRIQSLTEVSPGQLPLPPSGAAVPTGASSSSLGKPWKPTDPIRFGKGGTYADIGLVGTVVVGGSTAEDIEGGTQLGGHDPNQRGFTLQGVELNIQGAVDTFFRANANILFSTDSAGETFTELEEAWAETLSLPGNLSLRAGQYLSEFGRINTQHPHSWSFVDSPLVTARLFGPDGLRNPGARIAWLVPTKFYSELSFGIQNSQGETATSFRSSGHSHGEDEEDEPPMGYRHNDNDRGVQNIGDMLFTPRYAVSFDLTDSQTVVLGVSGAFGPNSSGGGGDTDTQIYGVDGYWKWKSANAHGGFPFVSLQAEALLRRYDLGVFDWQDEADAGETAIIDETTGLPAVMSAESVDDFGFYAQLLYGFKKGWVAGLRYDQLRTQQGNYEKMDLSYDGSSLGRDPERNARWRLSPNLTWYPSEFSLVRLQYNYDDRRGYGVDHSVWLQFQFLLGAHAAHTF
jgi:hypothetical protein